MQLGDAIDGLLRISQIRSLQMGVVDSIIEYSEFLATWLNELSKYIRIDYYQCGGNHDEIRILTGKKGDFPHENASKLILEFIKNEIIKVVPNMCNDVYFTQDIRVFSTLVFDNRNTIQYNYSYMFQILGC